MRDEFAAAGSSYQRGGSRDRGSSREVEGMATFALIHGGGDVGWYWHLVEQALRADGHDVVAPDLPCEDDSATLWDYAETVIDAIGGRGDLVVVGQSYGGFTAPLVADRCHADMLVFVAGMVPVPGEAPAEWWDNTGYREAVEKFAPGDRGATGGDDPFVTFYHDVPRALAQEATSKERGESRTAYGSPWPLEGWPDVPTGFVLCTEDRFFPAAFMRRVVAERLAIAPVEIAAGHCVALSRPNELAAILAGYAADHGVS
jgi:pimeloyl-ACP methyl ester carboxylesterase